MLATYRRATSGDSDLPCKLGYYLGPRAPELFDETERAAVRTHAAEGADLKVAGLAHRMLVDSVHIRFLTASRQYPNYKFLTWVDQYSPWWQKLREYGVPVQADGYGEYIMLSHFDALLTFFLELDRGTERGEGIRGKIERYVLFAKTGQYEERFATSTPFRVLFITTGKERLENRPRTSGTADCSRVVPSASVRCAPSTRLAAEALATTSPAQ
jgi:hypothetical protein